jgi:starch synthase (maltosyl-transferring)
VRIFRVDNPHTKPFPFWEWLIEEIRKDDPDVLFLAEAFTRRKVMQELAKLGFNQSYTYFTWKNSRHDLVEYVVELATSGMQEYYRPNFFANTPDILHEYLVDGGPPAFHARLVLAATLSPSYGIYNGFELIEYEPIPGREEFINSEKYEIKTRDWNKPGNIKAYLGALNVIRRENAALQQTANLRFLTIDDDGVIGFIKESVDGSNAVAGAIAIDGHAREFWLHFGDATFGGKPVRAIKNLITGEERRLEWGGVRLRLNPQADPALIFQCVT